MFKLFLPCQPVPWRSALLLLAVLHTATTAGIRGARSGYEEELTRSKRAVDPGSMSGSFRRVCYFTNWAQYRSAQGKMLPENIDPWLCTHLVFAFADLDSNNELKAREWNDEDTSSSTGMYSRFNNLKTINPALRTSLGVGGWNFGTTQMTLMLATTQSRAHFVSTSIQFLRQRNFDGLDLDFEYPGSRGSPPEDKQKFALLCQELKAAFEAEAQTSSKEQLLLTAAVPAGGWNLVNGYDVPTISAALDYLHVMSYDMNQMSALRADHHSPLRAPASGFSMEWSASEWMTKGAPAEKLVMGMSAYGRGYTLASTSNTAMGAPITDTSVPGPYTGEPGFMAYYEICILLSSGLCTRHWDDLHKIPYIVCGNQWFGYDDVQSFTEKTNWVKSEGFAGAMVWAVTLDDFSGQFCNNGTFPLLNTIKNILTCSDSSCTTQVTDTTQSLSTVTSSTHPSSSVPSSTEPSSTVLSSTMPSSMVPPSTVASSTVASSTVASSTVASSTVASSTQTSSTTTHANSTEDPAEFSPGTFCNTKSSGNFAHPHNRKRYVACVVAGVGYDMPCPAGLYYYEKKNQCDY